MEIAALNAKVIPDLSKTFYLNKIFLKISYYSSVDKEIVATS